MKYLTKKDSQLRKNVSRFEFTRNLYLSMIRTQTIKPSKKFFFLRHVESFYFPGRIKGRSIETDRARSILRYFRVSRIEFRLNSLHGKYSGVRKSSW